MTTRHHTATAAAAVIICAGTMTLTACSSSSSGTHTTSAPAPTQTTGGPKDPNWARGITALNGFLKLEGTQRKLPASASEYATPTMISNDDQDSATLWDRAKDGPVVRTTGHTRVLAWKPVMLNLAGPAAPAGNPWKMKVRACVGGDLTLYNKAGKAITSAPATGSLASVSLVSDDKGSHWQVAVASYTDKAKAPGGDPKCGGPAKSTSPKSSSTASKKPAKGHKK